MYDTLLVPTDGSEHAQRAAAHARQLATAFDADVHVLAVVDVATDAGPFNAGGVDKAYVERLEARYSEAIDDVEQMLGSDLSVKTALRRGGAAEEILEYIETEDVDALAMGTHGRTGVGRFVAGSVTETVLRKSPVPVLTVRTTDRSEVTGTYDEILLPTDGSEAASAAFEHGIAVAAAFDARIHAVNVVDIGALSIEEPLPASVLENRRNAGQNAVEAVARQARESDLEVVTAVRDGYPAGDLLEYAEENEIDLIPMATTGRTGLSRFLLGSTTERVVRHAEIPVLAVNARET
jgi:nucleotide-binding universal stress UspA family protein